MTADASLTNALSGFSDVGEAFRNYGNTKNIATDTYAKAENNATLKQQLDSTTGNIMWKELKRNNIKKMMTSSNEDIEYGTIMSISGTYVIKKPKENAASPQTADFDIVPFPDVLQPKDYIEGGSFKIYTCGSDTSECAAPTATREITLKGLKNQIYQALTGSDESSGLIQKFHSNQGAQLTAAENQILSGLPQKAATVISNLSTYDVEAAKGLAEEISYAVAMHLAYDVTRQYLRMARYAVGGSKSPNKDDMIKRIDMRLNTIDNEYLAYSKVHRPLTDIMTEYNAIQKNITKMALLTGKPAAKPNSDGVVD